MPKSGTTASGGDEQGSAGEAAAEIAGEVAAETDAARRFFEGSPLGLAVFERVRAILAEHDEQPATANGSTRPRTRVRTTASEVAFRRDRAFAWLWRPGRWLRGEVAEVVLSIALGREDPSPRFKEVVRPGRLHWIHHLEIRSVDDLDEEVACWLAEAADRPAPGSRYDQDRTGRSPVP